MDRKMDGWKVGRAQTDGQIGINTSLTLQTQYHFRPRFFSCSSESLCVTGEETESQKETMSLRWHHQGAWLCHLRRGTKTDGQKRDMACSSLLSGWAPPPPSPSSPPLGSCCQAWLRVPPTCPACARLSFLRLLHLCLGREPGALRCNEVSKALKSLPALRNPLDSSHMDPRGEMRGSLEI